MTLDARRLLASLAGTDREAAQQARLVLGGLGPDDDIDVHVLAECLAYGRPEELAFWAMVALGRLGRKASTALVDLASAATTHPSFGIRQEALRALVAIGPAEAATKSAVVGRLADPHALVRRQALQAIIEIPGLQASDFDRIAEMSSDPDPDVRRWMEIAMRNITLRSPASA